MKALETTKVIVKLRQTSKMKDWVPSEKMTSKKGLMVIKSLHYLIHSRMEIQIIIKIGGLETKLDSH
jgi:hypothetical protein